MPYLLIPDPATATIHSPGYGILPITLAQPRSRPLLLSSISVFKYFGKQGQTRGAPDCLLALFLYPQSQAQRGQERLNLPVWRRLSSQHASPWTHTLCGV